MMVKVFEEQCEVVDIIEVPADKENDDDDKNPPQKQTDNTEKSPSKEAEKDVEVIIKKSPGGDVVQNPSDPDATYDGHKGAGYQAQASETCSDENEVQLFTSVTAQTASESDADAVELILEDLNDKGLMPNELLADTLYGSDENHESCLDEGIDLYSPVSGPPPKDPVETIEEAKELEKLDKNELKKQRLAHRRKEQETEEWRKSYNARAGIEGSFGGIKRKTGMVRLRYRGNSAVFTSILLKFTGWNIARAHSSAKFRAKVAKIIEEWTPLRFNGRKTRLWKARPYLWKGLSVDALGIYNERSMVWQR